MSRHGEVIAPGTVRFERTLPGPIERVWAYLTEPDKRALWLAGGPMELRVGGAVALEFRHSELSSEDDQPPAKYAGAEGHKMIGRLTACEPPRLLSYTWSEASNRFSEVTFELETLGEDVLLVLTHRDLGPRDNMVSVAAGWHTHLDVLVARLNSRATGAFWKNLLAHESFYETVL